MESGERSTANRRVVRRLLLMTVVMFGFGFALVPLYDVYCKVTGINGKTTGRIDREAVLSEHVDKERTVMVEFLSSVHGDMPWDFKPLVRRVRVHPGAVTEVSYIAMNRAGNTVTGQAVPSLAPGLAAKYFNKTECFCFTRQTLKPNEEKVMPLRFVVDPELPEDVGAVSLSYTFFQVEPANTAGQQAGMIEELKDAAGTASGVRL